jgi:hypothetical protein
VITIEPNAEKNFFHEEEAIIFVTQKTPKAAHFSKAY